MPRFFIKRRSQRLTKVMNESEQTMQRYLLGELSESEKTALEEKYFTDPQFFNEVLKTENELVDRYVRNQLAKDLRERFEQSYMSHPSRRDRVEFTAALVSRLDQKEQRSADTEESSWWSSLLGAFGGPRPALRLSAALATLVVVLGGFWIYVETQKRQRALEQTAREEQQRQQNAAEEARRAQESIARQTPEGSKPQVVPQPSPSPVEGSVPRSVSLALVVGGVRGGNSNEVQTLVIPPGTSEARLSLNLKESNYPSYQASLETIAGVEVFNQKVVKPTRARTGASFVFTVPVNKLANGDYVLTLKGNNSDGEVDNLSKSLFRVQKR